MVWNLQKYSLEMKILLYDWNIHVSEISATVCAKELPLPSITFQTIFFPLQV